MIQPEYKCRVAVEGDTRSQLFPARQRPLAATASLLVACSFLAVLGSAGSSWAQGSSAQGRIQASCDDAAELAVLPSPVVPWKGAPLRVVFAAENPLEGELSLIAP